MPQTGKFYVQANLFRCNPSINYYGLKSTANEEDYNHFVNYIFYFRKINITMWLCADA